jgi:4-hydroxy-tetrahydrodipicolinate synthase
MTVGPLRGSFVPLVTPFDEDLKVDYGTYASLVERQVAGGSHGVVVTGTSGEPSSLTVGERAELVRVAVQASAGRLPIVAATGSESLAATAELTRQAQAAGADAVLVVTPYYSAPPQRGLVQYFAEVGRNTDLPLLIYHIPGRAAVTISVDSVAEIADRLPTLAGMKYAGRDLGYLTDLFARLGRDFTVFVGLEELSLPMLAVGAQGLMNAVANMLPGPVAELADAVHHGDLKRARDLHFRLDRLNKAIFWDTNPIPIKYLLQRTGVLPVARHRLPLLPAPPELQARLDELLAEVGGLVPGAARMTVPAPPGAADPPRGRLHAGSTER